MRIDKPGGGTPTERLLSTLCEKTFLKLWSWPNPRKDDGKELCDLIAIFDNHVFIFFDRESKGLQNSRQDISVTWPRWKKATIDKQIKTANGAARYIRDGVVKTRFSQLRMVVGIAMAPPMHVEHNAEDFILLECEDWSNEQQAYYDGENEKLGFFKNAKRFERRIVDFE